MAALATFLGASGINAFWPLGGMALDTGPNSELRVRPAPNTYLFADGPPEHHFSPEVISQCVAVGIDHIRIQYEPTVIMWALDGIAGGSWTEGTWTDPVADPPAMLAYALDWFDRCIAAIQAGGLGVILSPILAGYGNINTVADVLGPDNYTGSTFTGAGARYQLYKAHLTTLGERYASYDPHYLAAPELLNEPPGNGSLVTHPPPIPNWGALYTGDWETGYQPDLHALMRETMPNHTILLTCDGWSNWQVITSYDPTPYAADLNTMWEYHPIDPVPIAELGYIYNQYYYLQAYGDYPGLRYPPGANGQTLEESIASMTAFVNADDSNWSSLGGKTETIAGLTSDLENYYGVPQDLTYLQEYINAVTTWARSYDLAPGNMHAGEWGATRPNTGFPGDVIGDARGYIGASRLDRMHLYSDVTTALVQAGHRRAADHLDTLDYGITTAQNNIIGPWDERIITVMRPRLVILLTE